MGGYRVCGVWGWVGLGWVLGVGILFGGGVVGGWRRLVVVDGWVVLCPAGCGDRACRRGALEGRCRALDTYAPTAPGPWTPRRTCSRTCSTHAGARFPLPRTIIPTTHTHQPHLQHAREARALVLAGRAKVHGARDVGGAAVKLRAAVQQQQGGGVHRAAAAGLGAVVDDGAVGAGACEGGGVGGRGGGGEW